MIDHLLRFPSEKAAQAALPQFWRDGDGKDDPGGWDTSQCIPDTKVYRVTGTVTDEDGNVTETRDYVKGWFIQIGMPVEDQVLNKLAAATIMNREAKTRSKVDATVAAKAGWCVEPVFAGT
jgi:hypothetical protein